MGVSSKTFLRGVMNSVFAPLLLSLFLTTVCAASATGYQNSDAKLQDKNVLMDASCRNIARNELPLQIINAEDPSSPYYVESMTLKKADDHHLVYWIALAWTVNGRISVEENLEYNCFRCVNRLYEQIVLTTESDPELVCQQESF